MFDKGRKSCKVCRKNYNAGYYKARKNNYPEAEGEKFEEVIKINI